MRKSYWIILVIILVSLAIGAYFYPQFPDQVASHWNFAGEVDGYMPKFWGLFLMPLLSVVLFILFILIPFIDPLRTNIEKFRKYFDTFIVLTFLFLLYIYLLTIAWNLGWRFDMGQCMIPAVALLFFYAGILTEHAKPNWFIGIRTPWTLSNEKVWDKTHRLGGTLFKLSGVIAVAGLLFPSIAFWFVVFPFLSATIFIIVYSYVLFRKYQKQSR